MLLLNLYNFDDSNSSDIKELVRAREEEGEEEGEEEPFRCNNCRHCITTKGERITVGETHEHTFVNPGGFIFHIGCFGEARGCLESGRETYDHTWFADYSWRLAVCENCLSHLGWVYHSENNIFYGLIVNRLTLS